MRSLMMIVVKWKKTLVDQTPDNNKDLNSNKNNVRSHWGPISWSKKQKYKIVINRTYSVLPSIALAQDEISIR